MNLMYETLEIRGQNCFLVGDLYHWQLDQNGYFMIEKNSDGMQESNRERYFENINVDAITQDIQ